MPLLALPPSSQSPPIRNQSPRIQDGGLAGSSSSTSSSSSSSSSNSTSASPSAQPQAHAAHDSQTVSVSPVDDLASFDSPTDSLAASSYSFLNRSRTTSASSSSTLFTTPHQAQLASSATAAHALRLLPSAKPKSPPAFTSMPQTTSSTSSSSSTFSAPMRPPKLPRRLESTGNMPSLRRMHTFGSQQSGTSDGLQNSLDGDQAPSEGAASMSLKSLQPHAEHPSNVSQIDLREVAICNSTVCATIFCTQKRLIISNETANREKRSISEVHEDSLRALFEHVAHVNEDLLSIDLKTFAEQHDCTVPPFHTLIACPIRVPPFAGAQAVIVGMMMAFDAVERDVLAEEDNVFMRHLADAASFVIEDHFAATRRQGELTAQRAIVDLNRLLAGEDAPAAETRTSDVPGKPVSATDNAHTNASLFGKAARALCEALNANAAVIIDISSFRLRPGANTQASSSTLFGSDSDHTSQDATTSEENCPPTPALSKDGPSGMATLQDRLLFEREPTRAILNTETSCFYGLSPQPLPIVGASGEVAVLEHFRTLGGEASRPCIARFLASRHLTRSFGETKAEGEFEAGRAKMLRKPDSLVPLLPEQCKGLLVAPVYEANQQPAFLMLATFEDPPYRWEEPDLLLIEQMGAVLLSGVHRARARAVDVAQTYFMRKVSHELRTPLHAILGVTEMTRLALPPHHEELISLIDSINLAADSLRNTIDDLVDFNALNGTILHTAPSKSTTPKVSVSVFDIFGAISDAAVQQYLYRRRILRQIDHMQAPDSFDTDFPPPEMIIRFSPISNAALKKVDIDVETLQRIVSKVISNALRATDTGLITVFAAISQIDADSPNPGSGPSRRKSRKKVPELEIIVSDTGKGMTEDFLKARLFEPFSQEDPFTTGTGLSLTLCRNMIDELGGRVQVSSVVGEGTHFFIYVPLHAAIEVFPTKRALATSRTAIPAFFVGFEDEQYHGFKTYRSHLIRQFDLVQVNEEDMGSAKVIFVRSEAMEVESAMAMLDDGLGSAGMSTLPTVTTEGETTEVATVEGATTKGSPLIVILHAFEIDEQPYQPSKVLAEFAKARGCEVLTLQRPFGFKGILLLDDKIRERGDVEGEPEEKILLKKAGMLGPGVQETGGRWSPQGRTSADFKVLVVEDNPLNARILTTMLRKIGIDFHEATNGREAVDMYSEHQHDVVLMDISMPEMDGFEACERIKAMEGSEFTRIIAITALSSELDRIRGREVGFAEWIVKPIRLGPLAQDVKNWKEDVCARLTSEAEQMIVDP
ncbi:hypothetical protein A4X09_0g2881 [Tilletia walkeri]|uniref:histidine kinase n=1 Tax=Tilletia walkeri TaxID=117179 RepID=A0A8X7NAF7_9BASI|nr:hypothetical protein A4X09_0g2881 [Tilletia walkeri]